MQQIKRKTQNEGKHNMFTIVSYAYVRFSSPKSAEYAKTTTNHSKKKKFCYFLTSENFQPFYIQVRAVEISPK